MADLKPVRHIFFDLDDTLWVFRKNASDALSDLFKKFDLGDKLKTSFPEFLRVYFRINLEMWSLFYKRAIDKNFMREERFNQLFQHFNYHNRMESAAFSKAYLNSAPQGSAIKPGCIETLTYLSRKYRLHIITNGFIESQAIKIDAAKIRHFFDQVIVCEEHALVKPESAVFQLAQHLSGAKAEECVMIGDSLESDIEGALRAGWQAILFDEEGTTNYSGLSVSELPALKRLF
jgi:putative hydrolase of the HAD superfamily